MKKIEARKPTKKEALKMTKEILFWSGHLKEIEKENKKKREYYQRRRKAGWRRDRNRRTKREGGPGQWYNIHGESQTCPECGRRGVVTDKVDHIKHKKDCLFRKNNPFWRKK